MKKTRRKNIIVECFDRQKGVCNLCHHLIISLHETNLDHIIPKAKGGTNTRKNLQLVHRKCNTLKGSRDNLYSFSDVSWEHY